MGSKVGVNFYYTGLPGNYFKEKSEKQIWSGLTNTYDDCKNGNVYFVIGRRARFPFFKALEVGSGHETTEPAALQL